MNRKRDISVLIMLIVFGGLMTQPLVAETWDLETLQAGVADSLESIASCSANFSESYNPEKGKGWGPENHRWSETPTQLLLVEFYPGKKNVWRSFDGKKSFQLVWGESDTSHNSLEVRTRSDPKMWEKITPFHAIGKRILFSDIGLPELLKSASISQLSDADSVHPNMVFPVMTNSGISLHLELIIDTEHEFLPKEIRLTPAEGSKVPNEWKMNFVVDSYQEVRDLKEKRSRPFPKTVRFIEMNGVKNLEFSDVRINPSLSSNEFRPSPPTGTLVVDVSRPVGMQEYIHGNSKDIDSRIQQLAKQSERVAEVGPIQRSVDASQEESRLHIWIAWMSIGILAISAFVWFRASH